MNCISDTLRTRQVGSSTDYTQIVNDGRFLNKKVKYPTSNPAVLDRFAATNMMLKNAVGRRSLFIHPKCKNLRADLLARTDKEGTREPDDKPGTDLGHITDALGYPIHMLCRLRRARPNAKINITGVATV